MSNQGGTTRSGTFAQPSGFWALCTTEFAERLAFYGMQSILVLYLSTYLFQTKAPEEIWLLATVAHLFEIKGQALASAVTGGYLMAVSITPLIGGWLTDYKLGPHRAVIVGGTAMAAGHLLLAYEPALIPALLCVAIGSGLFRGAIAIQFGALYPEDSKRAEAFQLFFIAVNIAGLTAPLLIGTVGEKVGWHWGFGIAALAMTAAMAVYLSTARNFIQTPVQSVDTIANPAKQDWLFVMGIVAAVGLSAIPNLQLFNAYLLWAERDVDLQMMGYRMPTSWLIGIDALLGLCVLAASIPAWRAIERRYGDFPLMRRLVIASIFVCAGAAALVMAELTRGETKIALFWPIMFQLLNSIGLAQILPGVVALLGGSPEGRASATALSFYFVGLFVASLGSTLLAAQFGNMEVWLFWSMHLGCTLAGAMIFAILNSKRKNARGDALYG